MSILYGFKLVFARASFRRAVEALARRLDPAGFAGCRVVLPGEPTLWLPCEATTEDGPTDEIALGASGPSGWMKGAIWVPVDASVRRYMENQYPARDPMYRPPRTPEDRANEERASIGQISIFLDLGEQAFVVHLGAVTSNMSHLFEQSLALRGEMLTLLAEGDGLVALLDREPGDSAELLDAPCEQVELGDYASEDPASIDAFAARAIEAASRASEGRGGRTAATSG